jgi:peptidyl-prolyl cis-trans isomerase A (cyclophilin A)
MRNTTLILMALLAAGCEHKRGTDNKQPPTGTPREPAPDPAPGARKTVPVPAGGDGDVRAPVAADLEAYTKDIPGQGKLMATFETPLGNITCELFPDKAPATVANFVGLATGKKPWLNPKTSNVEKGVPYYDGLIFHRVIQGFMLQGGDPLGQGTGGPGYKFEDELSPEMDMGPGTLAMANAGPVTNGSQFFIMDNASRPDLAKKHSIFGMCKELDVIAKISATPKGARDKPQTPVTMKIKITKA